MEKSEWESNDEVNQNGEDSVEEGEVRATPEEEAVQSIPEVERPPGNGETPGATNSAPKIPRGSMHDMHGVVEEME
ncbi:hypothetical protein Hanom_Chr01g00029981 [Helianthus anomalus]